MSGGYKIKNWREFQHYSKRNPPWVKLHYELLTSRDWVMLDDASRVLAIASMLLASRNDGVVPNDTTYVQRVAYLNNPPNFKPLVDCGFLIPDGIDTPESAIPNTDTNTETNTETEMLASASKMLATCKRGVLLPFGEYGRVLLSEVERAQTEADYQGKGAQAIDILDAYLEQGKGKKYANHRAVLKRNGWVWKRMIELKLLDTNLANAEDRAAKSKPINYIAPTRVWEFDSERTAREKLEAEQAKGQNE